MGNNYMGEKWEIAVWGRKKNGKIILMETIKKLKVLEEKRENIPTTRSYNNMMESRKNKNKLFVSAQARDSSEISLLIWWTTTNPKIGMKCLFHQNIVLEFEPRLLPNSWKGVAIFCCGVLQLFASPCGQQACLNRWLTSFAYSRCYNMF